MIVTVVKSFVEEAKCMDDVYKKLLENISSHYSLGEQSNGG
ncbi:hypothetical protein HJC23_006230 [Cyclotella cryptica]|uniref:Uncharacterized protein n=1 Tax=Cyclotella cryptica TaxID=29204 RepID=A0ABD3PWL2_9STRA